MKELWNKFCEKFYTSFHNFMIDGGGYIIFIFAIVAILFAIVGFYGQNGFDWRWNVFFLFPLYIFCGWALWQAMKMYNKTLKDNDERKKKNQNK